MANTDSIYWIDAYITPGQPGHLDRHGNSQCCSVVTIGHSERHDIRLWCRAWYRSWMDLLTFIDGREILESEIVGPHQFK